MTMFDRETRTVCGYCGVGCAIELETEKGRVVAVNPSHTSDANTGNLCVKGRFGMDFIHHPERLTTPLMRRGGKDSPLEPATWDEAIQFAARRFNEIKAKHGPHALAGITSARATNEDNYVFQKLVRALMGTNNIDHCARLCHAGSVTGLQLSIGSSAMSNSIAEMENLQAFIVTGSNTTETHPVIANFLKRAVRKNGAKLIVIDPRRVEMTDFATLWLRQNPGTDVAVFQAMAHTIVKEGLYDPDFIAYRTEGFNEYLESLETFTPEWAESVSGVPAESIREAARIYAGAERAAIYWGMGISQSTHGTDNTLSLVNLALMCGHVGKAGTGLNPLRGQNNVQGCSDSGGLPNVFTAYQRVDDDAIRGRFESVWGVPLSPTPGLTATEMCDACYTQDVRAMFVLGENPMMSEPNQNHARAALEKLDFLVCQDIFINETGEMADVILPATSFAEKDGTFTNTDRRVQRCRAAVPPVGRSRADWDILSDLGRRIEVRLGLRLASGFDYAGPEDIWEEMRRVTPDFWGIDYARLEREGGVHWPCPSLDHPGSPFLFSEDFPRGAGKLWPVAYGVTSEQPDEEYPFTLNTGRVLYHWHGGTLTRHSRLEQAWPECTVEMHPHDAARLGLATGDWVEVASRRGQISARLLVTGRSPERVVFIPFHFAEAAANTLTDQRLDKRAKIPDYKVCSVRVSRAAAPPARPGADLALTDRGAIKNPVGV